MIYFVLNMKINEAYNIAFIYFFCVYKLMIIEKGIFFKLDYFGDDIKAMSKINDTRWYLSYGKSSTRTFYLGHRQKVS